MKDPYLNKRYGSVVLTQKLGQGSMGVVYKGYHEAFDKDVAVKIMSPVHNEHSEQFHQRFLREGRAAAKVQHQNVVQVIDAGQEGKSAYLVLEFVSGANLGEILDKTGIIDQTTVTRLGKQIANGLAAIHELNIIHRDIKPENILLGQGGIIKIADLGLAKELQDEESVNRLTMSGMVVGTPYYISPEAISDITNAGPATDIYSFGATLYHLLLGRPPFEGGSAYEVMRAHLEQRFQPIREINSKINPNLAQLIEQCLEKDPEKRPSAKDIAKVIDRGGRVQGNHGSFAIIALFITAFFGASALITWNLLPHANAQSDLVIGKNASALHIQTSHPQAELRIDLHPWRKIETADLALSPGEHRLRLRAYEDGVLMHWQDTINITTDHATETQRIQAQLHPITITPYTINLSGVCDPDSLVYLNGRCLGRTQSLRIDQAGNYAIGIWKGHQWLQQKISLDVNGAIDRTVIDRTSSENNEWTSSAIVPHEIFLQRFLDHQNVTPHHMLTWIECEKIRTQRGLNQSRSWQEQGLQPLQAARDIDSALVVAIDQWATGNKLEICKQEQAQHFKRLYNYSLWYKDGQHSRALGRSESASIILLPSPR